MILSKNQYFEKAYLIAYLLVAATLPLYQIHLNSVAIMLLGLVWLLEPDWKSKYSNFRKTMPFSGTIVAFFLFHLVGLAYTDDIKEGLFDIEKKLTFLIFPLIIFSTSYPIPLKWIQAIFVVSLSALMAWDIVDVVMNATVMQNYQLASGDDNFRLALVEYHGMHPTYRSLHALAGMAFAIALWNSFPSKLAKIGLSFSILMFGIFLVLMASRIVFGSILFSSVIYILVFSPRKIRFKLSIILGFSVFSLALLLWTLPSSKARFTELINTSFSPPTGGVHNSTSLRAAHLFCDIELTKSNFVLGIGTGDVQNLMDDCYRSNHFSDFLYTGNRHNCHNQYFQTWIGLGLPGLFALLLIYILPFVIFKNQLHFAYYFVLFSFAMSGVTETVFGVQKGIVFFTFFYCLLAQNNLKIRTH